MGPEEGNAFLLGSSGLGGVCVWGVCACVLWPWAPGVADTQPECLQGQWVSSLFQLESVLFQQHSHPKNQPQRKGRRHIREK